MKERRKSWREARVSRKSDAQGSDCLQRLCSGSLKHPLQMRVYSNAKGCIHRPLVSSWGHRQLQRVGMPCAPKVWAAVQFYPKTFSDGSPHFLPPRCLGCFLSCFPGHSKEGARKWVVMWLAWLQVVAYTPFSAELFSPRHLHAQVFSRSRP